MTIKQHGGVFGRNPTFNNVSVETLSIDGTAISSTAAELNILDGVTANSTEINYLDGASTSVVTASKAVLANASANIAFASGQGIDFSATSGTGTSELFDDYEEGTFTPTVIGQTTPGTGTYTRNVGFYTKIGDRVIFTIAIDMTAHTGSGNMRLAGLPFTASSVSGDLSYFDAAASNLTYSGQLKAYVSGGSTEAAFLSMASGTSLSAVALDTSCELRLTGVYRSV